MPRSHRARSCSSSGTSPPRAPTRAGWRASVSSMRARRPPTSVDPGTDCRSRRARWTASAARSASRAGAPLVVWWASVNMTIQDVEHRPQAFSDVRRPGQHPVGVDQAAFRTGDPLGDGGLGQLVGVGDLCRGEAGDRAEGQRDLPRAGQRRVTAQLEKEQGVVTRRGFVPERRLQHRDAVLARTPARVAADPVDVPSPGRRHEPCLGVVRRAPGPLAVRVQQRVLHGVLAQVEPAAAVRAHQPGEGLRRELAPQTLVHRGLRAHPSPRSANTTGRISSARPGIRASGIWSASSTARASSSTSSR